MSHHEYPQVGARDEVFVELYVREIELSIRIFCEVLGFELVRHEEDFAELRHGGSRLLLNSQATQKFDQTNPIRSFPEEMSRGVGVELVVKVGDLEDCYARSRKTGTIKVLTEIESREWGAKDFRFIHPDGFYVRVSD